MPSCQYHPDYAPHPLRTRVSIPVDPINNQNLNIMVRIVDYKERKNSLGESFYALVIEGGMELTKSRETGRM